MKSPIPLTARPPPSLSPNRQGKKKLSAEEKAAKAAEKAAKEEEKRRKAEEKARRQEEARLKREAEDKEFEAEEHERVAQEDAELEPNRTESAGFHTRRDAILADDVRTRRHEHEWDRAARCVTRPDPRSIQAFEAHVEATLATPPLPFHEAFQLMEECELLAKDCEVYRAWAAEDGDDATAAALASRARTARAGVARVEAGRRSSGLRQRVYRASPAWKLGRFDLRWGRARECCVSRGRPRRLSRLASTARVPSNEHVAESLSARISVER